MIKNSDSSVRNTLNENHAMFCKDRKSYQTIKDGVATFAPKNLAQRVREHFNTSHDLELAWVEGW